jgi:hypothetical protein
MRRYCRIIGVCWDFAELAIEQGLALSTAERFKNQIDPLDIELHGGWVVFAVDQICHVIRFGLVLFYGAQANQSDG